MKTILRAAALSASTLLAMAQAAPAPSSGAAGAAPKESWAIATRANEHRTIIYRYIDELGPKAGERAFQRERVTLRWHYDADANNGMPTDADKAGMDELEDLLDPVVERDGFSNLALVTTGEGDRVWIWYARSGADFRERMARAMRGHGPYPVEVDVATDPGWTAYEDVVGSVRR